MFDERENTCDQSYLGEKVVREKEYLSAILGQVLWGYQSKSFVELRK